MPRADRHKMKLQVEYVKQDLRIAERGVILYGNEVIADDFCVR